MTRQIVLDTETTGLEVSQGHRVIEIGCVEMKGRRLTQNNFHHYVNPDRQIDAGAQQVHGISNDFLASKPRFVEVAQTLWDFLEGAELLIHNAPFDLGFLNEEFRRAGFTRKIEDVCSIQDTVMLARRLHPGQKNSLDALCKRYSVDNSRREFHGALLDAHLLADVYLSMTGGQSALLLESDSGKAAVTGQSRLLGQLASKAALVVVVPSEQELADHQGWVDKIAGKGLGFWKKAAD